MVSGKFAYGAFGELDGTPIYCRHVEQPIHYAETETVFLREDGSALHVFETDRGKEREGLVTSQRQFRYGRCREMGIVVGPQDAVACEQCFESTRSYFAFLYHDIVSFLFALFPVARRGSAADCTRTLTHGCSNSYLPVTVPAWDIYAMGTGCGDGRDDPTPSLCIIEHLFPEWHNSNCF